jgi:uncharacterized protein
MRNSPILNALFPNARTKILAVTVTRADKEWYLTELASFLDTSPSSLQRELDALSKAGILEKRRDGRRTYFKADKRSPVFTDLRNLLEKTAGIIPVLKQELAPLQDRIRVAFVYGSVARSQEASDSDIDLMLVGDIGLSDLVPALRSAERSLGRAVNPTVYSTTEFARKAKSHDHFLDTVLKGKKEFVKGAEYELEAIVG